MKTVYRITWTLDNAGLEDLGFSRYETVTGEYPNTASAAAQLDALRDAWDRGRVVSFAVCAEYVDGPQGLAALRLV